MSSLSHQDELLCHLLLEASPTLRQNETEFLFCSHHPLCFLGWRAPCKILSEVFVFMSTFSPSPSDTSLPSSVCLSFLKGFTSFYLWSHSSSVIEFLPGHGLCRKKTPLPSLPSSKCGLVTRLCDQWDVAGGEEGGLSAFPFTFSFIPAGRQTWR